MADEYWTSPVHSTSYEPPTVTVVPLADLEKCRNERDEFMRERDLALQNARAVALYAEERQRERDEARDEVARLNAVIVKLSGEKLRVALTDEQVDAARALLALVHYDDLAASWLDLLPPALGGPFGSRP